MITVVLEMVKIKRIPFPAHETEDKSILTVMGI
jgi:hypothetical protein